MRAFLLVPVALAAAVSAARLEQRSPFHAITSSLVARDVIDPNDIPDQCKSACADTVHDLNTCENDVKCLCTKSNGKQLVKCVDCFVKISGLDPSVTIGQLTLDNFVTGCKNAGKDVGTLTLGSSSSALHLVANGAATAAALAVMVAYLF